MDDNLIEQGIEGEAILTCAARVAQAVENSESYAEIMAFIAIRCSERGLLGVAVELADAVGDPYAREQTLTSIIVECVGYDEVDYAEELLSEIEDEGLRGAALEQMAVKYAERGDFVSALEVAEGIDGNSQALSRIAQTYADGARFTEALDLTQSIEEEGLRTNTFIELASKSLRAGRSNEETAQLLAEAEASAGEMEYPEQEVSALVSIASLYKDSGQEEKGLEILSGALKLCGKIEGSNPVGMSSTYTKDGSFAQLAGGFAQLHSFDQADLIVERIDNAAQFAVAAADVAVEYHRAGRTEQAINLLNEALEVTTGEEAYGEQTQMMLEGVLARLAHAYAEVGRYEDALRIAGMLSPTEFQPDLRYGTLQEIAWTCVRSGNHEPIFQAEELIEKPYAKVLYDLEVGDRLNKAGQKELADRLFSHALATTETISLPYEKALALMEVAERLAAKGEGGRASELFFKSLEATSLIGGHYQKARALVLLDGAFKKCGLEPGEREESALEAVSSEQ